MSEVFNWRTERVALGEKDMETLSPPQRESLSELRRSDEAILQAYPPALIAKKIKARMQPKMRAPWVLVPALAAVAAFVVLSQPPPSPERVKGNAETRLIVRRAHDRHVEILADGDAAQANDVLQLSYVSAGAFGVVVSVDSRGNVTPHLPRQGAMSPALKTSGEVELPYSYQLDDAPRFERFFFVTAAQPFSVQTIIEAAGATGQGAEPQLAPLLLPTEMSQQSFLVRKTP